MPPTRRVPERLQRLERRLADRLAEQHLQRLVAVGTTRAGVRSGWRLLGVVVALPVHAVSIALTGGGAWLLLTGWTWPLRVLGAVLVLAALATRPTAPGLPDHVARLRPADAPLLFGLVDRVAAVTGAPVPAEILVVDQFNAFAAYVGWRRRRVLGLGAPLWVPSSPQGRVALIGHELGHFAHGDLTHGRWVDGAAVTLCHWLDIAGGMHHVTYGGVHVVQRYLFAPVRGLLIAYLALLTWATAPSRQRQELLADLDAAETAGTDAAVAELDLTLSDATIETALTRAAVSPHRPDLWAVLREATAALTAPALEGQRIRALTERSRIDNSHPATLLRIRLLESRPPRPGVVCLTPDECAALDAEVAPTLLLAAKAAGERIRYRR